VPEESRPKVCEGATMVTVGSPSLVPPGSYLCFRTFITKSKGLGGPTMHEEDTAKYIVLTYFIFIIFMYSLLEFIKNIDCTF
jgi:hypothetical protein